MSGWDFNAGGSDKQKAEFTKFPEGITRVRIVEDAPFVRWTHWFNKYKRSANCPGKECPVCEIRKHQKANRETPTYNMSKRLAIQVLNRENGKLEIMEQGITFFEELRDLMVELKEKGKTLADVDIRIKRRGTTQQDTSYRIDIGEEYPLSDADELQKGRLMDLSDYFKPTDPEKLLQVLQGKTWEEAFASGNSEEDTEEEIEIK